MSYGRYVKVFDIKTIQGEFTAGKITLPIKLTKEERDLFSVEIGSTVASFLRNVSHETNSND